VEESGPLRLRFPRIAAAGVLEGVLVNTGGGIAGGDRLRIVIETGEGAAVAVTGQAAEKVYRSTGSAAHVSVQLVAARSSRLHWLPQETILFDCARLARSIEAEVAEDARITICESVVFGRVAMGERVVSGMLRDRWRVRRAGKLVFADALRLDGSIAATLARPAVAAGATAVATIMQVAPNAERRLDSVRACFARASQVEAGVSAFDGFLVARLLARDALALRAVVLDALAALGTDPPRAFTL
jgi:urease accessory protein